MKKEYKKPELSVVNVETQNLMVLSGHETSEVLSRESEWEESDSNDTDWDY